jgi:PAS domain-containing protein
MGSSGTNARVHSDANEIRALLALHEIALGTMSHGLCMYDADRRVVLFNERFIDLFGMSPDVVRRGMSMRELFFHGAERMNADLAAAEESWLRRERKLLEGHAFTHHYELPDGRVVSAHCDRWRLGGGLRGYHQQERLAQEVRLQFERMNHALRYLTHALSMFDADDA